MVGTQVGSGPLPAFDAINHHELIPLLKRRGRTLEEDNLPQLYDTQTQILAIRATASTHAHIQGASGAVSRATAGDKGRATHVGTSSPLIGLDCRGEDNGRGYLRRYF